jgi:hypothetical protein
VDSIPPFQKRANLRLPSDELKAILDADDTGCISANGVHACTRKEVARTCVPVCSSA